jgi:hypothetical protein
VFVYARACQERCVSEGGVWCVSEGASSSRAGHGDQAPRRQRNPVHGVTPCACARAARSACSRQKRGKLEGLSPTSVGALPVPSGGGGRRGLDKRRRKRATLLYRREWWPRMRPWRRPRPRAFSNVDKATSPNQPAPNNGKSLFFRLNPTFNSVQSAEHNMPLLMVR